MHIKFNYSAINHNKDLTVALICILEKQIIQIL